MDIFISYKKEEWAIAERLARRLTEAGYDVWWDASLRSGERFEAKIEAALNECKAVIVLWSRLALTSEWVRAEADKARGKNKALPLIIDDLPSDDLPILFRGLHSISLSGWRGDVRSKPYKRLLEAIGAMAGPPGPSRTPEEAQRKLEAASQAAAPPRPAARGRSRPAAAALEQQDRVPAAADTPQPANKFTGRLEMTPVSWGLLGALVVSVGMLATLLLSGSASVPAFVSQTMTAVQSVFTPPPPAPSRDWSTHYSHEYGIEVSVPSDFGNGQFFGTTGMWLAQAGPFRLTILGGTMSAATFDAQLTLLKNDVRDLGWTVGEVQSASPGVSFEATRPDKVLYARVLPVCRGTQYGALEFEFPTPGGDGRPLLQQMSASLRETGAGTRCPVPAPVSGTVRVTPSVAANLIDVNGNAIGYLNDGAKVTIKSIRGKRFEVVDLINARYFEVVDIIDGSGGLTERSNIKVDQFVDMGFDRQFIQTASVSSRDAAEIEARKPDALRDVYLSTNGQFALVYRETFPLSEAEQRITGLKNNGNVPAGSYRTFGNSYVMKVCC